MKFKKSYIFLTIVGIISLLNKKEADGIKKFEEELAMSHQPAVVEEVKLEQNGMGFDLRKKVKVKDVINFVNKVKREYNKQSNKPQIFNKKDLELFDSRELTKTPYEDYGRLDYLGRPTEANAILHQSLMPTEKRKSISHVKPVGFKNRKYNFIPGKWVYNRCHLIGFALAGENDNEENLITGTREMNMKMVKYENEIANFIKRSPNNYVRYRVTPIYQGRELVARGLQIDAIGYGDDALNFSVYIENKQDGVEIDYMTGRNYKK